MVAPSAQIHEAITSPKLFQVPCVPNMTRRPPGSKILIPVTFMQSVPPLNVIDTNVQESQSSVTIQEAAVVSSSKTDEARQGDGKVDQINKPTTVTDSQSIQKLPSIDQIFKPLAQTSLVTTPPSVAANVEVSSLPVVGSNSCVHLNLNTDKGTVTSSQSTDLPANSRGEETSPTVSLESMQIMKNKRADRHKGQSSAATSFTAASQSSNAYHGWKGYPTMNKMPQYMYPPYPPTHPSYMRWPGVYSWPPCMPMASRYPPFYPCPLPSYNAYQH